MRTRSFLLTGLLTALLLAGVGSYYASSHPDGLEAVAERTGFLDSADDHAAADGPLADYAVDGVDDARLSGGLAGVVGVAVTLLLAGGLTWAVRRRGTTDDATEDGATEDGATTDGATDGHRRPDPDRA